MFLKLKAEGVNPPAFVFLGIEMKIFLTRQLSFFALDDRAGGRSRMMRLFPKDLERLKKN